MLRPMLTSSCSNHSCFCMILLLKYLFHEHSLITTDFLQDVPHFGYWQKNQKMVNKTDFVIIGITVGLTIGLLIACLVFFGIHWYKKRAHLRRCANDRSVSTLPIRTNGLEASIDSSASLSNSLPTKVSMNHAQKPQHSWWNIHSKDRFSASGIPRYSYKYVSSWIYFHTWFTLVANTNLAKASPLKYHR